MTTFKADDKRRDPNLVDNTTREILENQKPRVTKIAVSPTQANLQPGDSVEVQITSEPPEAELGDLKGISDAEGVATVSDKTVTAVSVGAANVRFEDEGSGLGASILIEVFEEEEEDEEGQQAPQVSDAPVSEGTRPAGTKPLPQRSTTEPRKG